MRLERKGNTDRTASVVLRPSLAWVLGLVLISSGALSGEADYADEVQRIEVANQIGAQVKLLFLSPADSEYWGPDVLGSRRTLSVDQTAEFYVHLPEECARFDLMALNRLGESYVLYGQEFCRSQPTKVIFEAAHRKPQEDRPLEFASLTFENQTGRELVLLFLSPGDSAMLGVDLLDAKQPLESGEARTILAPAYEDGVRFRALAVSREGKRFAFSIEVQGQAPVVYPIQIGDLQPNEDETKPAE